MAQELAKASAEMPEADISEDMSANNSQDRADLSGAEEDAGNSAPLYINEEAVHSTAMSSTKVMLSIAAAMLSLRCMLV